MTSKQETQRSDLRALQRERERERRRLRDRQRRQNMSQEQREKHLARRRRNYQLRRIRAENAKLNPEPPNQTLAITPPNAVAPAVAYVGLSELGSRAEGLEDGAHKSRNFPRRLCLHQIRQLARALNNPIVLCTDGSSRQNGVDLSTRQNSSTRNCGLIRTLRLIYVKRLARALKSTG